MMKRLYILLLIPLGFFVMTAFGSCANADAQTTIIGQSGELYASEQSLGPDGNAATYDQNPSNLPQSPLWTYINADGREVQNPTAYKAPPPNASAICRNGEFSFSKRRCGTCSGNGGVKEWLKKDLPKC